VPFTHGLPIITVALASIRSGNFTLPIYHALGTSAALQDWEQGRRRPEIPVRAYLAVIQRDPQAVIRALRAA